MKPKQMVVILHPQLQVFRDISERLDKVEKKEKYRVCQKELELIAA